MIDNQSLLTEQQSQIEWLQAEQYDLSQQYRHANDLMASCISHLDEQAHRMQSRVEGGYLFVIKTFQEEFLSFQQVLLQLYALLRSQFAELRLSICWYRSRVLRNHSFVIIRSWKFLIGRKKFRNNIVLRAVCKSRMKAFSESFQAFKYLHSSVHHRIKLNMFVSRQANRYVKATVMFALKCRNRMKKAHETFENCNDFVHLRLTKLLFFVVWEKATYFKSLHTFQTALYFARKKATQSVVDKLELWNRFVKKRSVLRSKVAGETIEMLRIFVFRWCRACHRRQRNRFVSLSISERHGMFRCST